MPRTDKNQTWDSAGNLISETIIVVPDEDIRRGQPRGQSDFLALGAYSVLTNVGTTYDATAPSKGLGIALVDFAGITDATFAVFYNKIGAGTLSWQLWNQTDGTELARIDDAATGDNKVGLADFTSYPLGLKLVRVRVKSTTAADDPVFYGATLRLS